MLLTLGPQAQLSEQIVLHAFRSINQIEPLTNVKRTRTVLFGLRVRRVRFRNRSVR
jgi:hypothetical protein